MPLTIEEKQETAKLKTLDELKEYIPEELNEKLKEYHCANCGRFLALQAIVEGTIVIKCRRCKEINVLDVRSYDES